MASAHVVCGSYDAIQCVPELGEPFAAAGSNRTHYHVEIVGLPSMTWSEWLAAPQTTLAARIIADFFTRHDLEVKVVDCVDDLLTGEVGVTTHWHVTQAVRKAHLMSLRGSPYYTTEHGHYDPYSSPRGPAAPGVDQFDLDAFVDLALAP